MYSRINESLLTNPNSGFKHSYSDFMDDEGDDHEKTRYIHKLLNNVVIQNHNETIYGREFVQVIKWDDSEYDESKIYKFRKTKKSSYKKREFTEEFYDPEKRTFYGVFKDSATIEFHKI